MAVSPKDNNTITTNDMKNTKVSDLTKTEQVFVISQLVRNQYAIDYWMAALSNIKELPICRHEVKRDIKQAEREVDHYNTDLSTYFTDGNVNPLEMVKDAACEYWRELKRMVGFYEEAVSRILLKKDTPYADRLKQLSIAKDLLSVVSYIDGLEALTQPRIRPLLKVGASITEQSRMGEEMEQKALPSVMGHFQRLSERINMGILRQIGIQDGTFESNAEVERAIKISCSNIQETLMDYELMWTLMEDSGHTLEEAKSLIAERKAKREAEAAKLKLKEELESMKKARKDLIKMAKKAAKNNIKKQTK